MKRLLSSVLVVIMILGFSACGGTGSDQQQGGAEPKSATDQTSTEGSANDRNVTIKFASVTNYGGFETVKQLIQCYEELNPNIKVELNELPPTSSSTEVHQTLVTSLASGADTFDVLTADCIWFPEFAEAGWLLELDKYISQDDLKDYFKGAIDTVTYKGQLIGMPWAIDSGLLYYRKDLLDKYGYQPPKTWDELVSQTKDILAKENNPELKGYIWQAKQAEVLVCNLVEFLGGKGKVLDDNGNIFINDENGKRAAQKMYDLIYKDKISPETVITYDEEPSRTVFSSGNAIFHRNWPYAWSICQDEKESKVVGNVGIAPLPEFEGAGSAACLGGYQFAANKATKYPDESADFVKFLSGAETQKLFTLTQNSSPTRQEIYKDPEVLQKNPLLPSLQSVFVNAAPRPITPYYPQMSLVLQTEFSKLLSNKQDVNTTVENCAEQIQALYKK